MSDWYKTYRLFDIEFQNWKKVGIIPKYALNNKTFQVYDSETYDLLYEYSYEQMNFALKEDFKYNVG